MDIMISEIVKSNSQTQKSDTVDCAFGKLASNDWDKNVCSWADIATSLIQMICHNIG